MIPRHVQLIDQCSEIFQSRVGIEASVKWVLIKLVSLWSFSQDPIMLVQFVVFETCVDHT